MARLGAIYVLDDDIEMNGQIVVLNDVLAFIYGKLKLVNEETVRSITERYFSVQDLREARNMLYSRIRPKDELSQLPKQRSKEEIVSIITELVRNYKDDFLFLPKDINNLPNIDILDKDSVKFFLDQSAIQQQLAGVLAEQAAVKKQLEDISAQLLLLREPKPRSFAQCLKIDSQTEPGTPSRCTASNPRSPRATSGLSGASGPRLEMRCEVEETPQPRGYTVDGEGFMSRAKKDSRPKRQRPMVIGTKSPTKLKPIVNDVRIFATRFSPDESETDIRKYIFDITGIECTVERILARTSRHASFLITASRRHEQVLLDPNTWEEGIQVRHFYGRLRNSSDIS